MKTVKTTKMNIVKAPQDEYYIKMKIVAFQIVKFEINFFGHEEMFTLDTKILENGKQYVIDGNGWIPDNYEIK